ncbi:MAG: STAS domain-containing protein [Candidatus Cloacimonetes bacterium]|nr:STAS domain-containing protein [Candidatus Cloacimonadota bacterium]
MLNIDIVKSNDFLTVFKLNGRFDGLGSFEFDTQVYKVNLAKNNVLLDFLDVAFLSSAGIRSLLKLNKLLIKNSSVLYLFGCQENVYHVLEMSGLTKFFRFITSENEYKDLISSQNESCSSCLCSEKELNLSMLNEKESSIIYWHDNKGQLSVSLEELSLAFGFGNLPDSYLQNESKSVFITDGNFFGVKEEMLPFDYFVSHQPSADSVKIDNAITLQGSPRFHLKCNRWKSTMSDLHEVLKDNQLDKQKFLFFCGFLKKGEQIFFTIGNCNHDSKIPSCLLLELEQFFHSQNEVFFELIKHNLSMNNIVELRYPSDKEEFDSFDLWFYASNSLIQPEEFRMKIEFENDFVCDEEWKVIIRKTFPEAKKVLLRDLAGGFTSRVFEVNGFDENNRKILPSVLKIGNIEITRREENAFNEYVKKFILNNSTQILSRYYSENFAGIRYNFVGMDSSEKSLRMLRDVYINEDTDFLKKIFIKTYSDILKPWYGQPVMEEFYPFREHDPRTTFFPDIIRIAEENLSISADNPEIYCSILERNLKNPYYILKHFYQKNRNFRMSWYKTVTHGDLNLQNIMLDRKDNIYIIDFSETNIRNCVSDFTRLEPILKTEFTAFDNDNSLAEMIRFEYCLQNVEKMSDIPSIDFAMSDSMKKMYDIILLMRKFADRITIFEESMLPYWFAVLEWTLPIAQYINVCPEGKRFALYSSAIICTRIAELTGLFED